MVESTALEMRHRGNSIGGSNPSLSATVYKAILLKLSLIVVACQRFLYILPLGFVPIYFFRSVACQQVLYILTLGFVPIYFFSKSF